MKYTLLLTMVDGQTYSYGPYPEYPITEMVVGASGQIQKFAWKSPDFEQGIEGAALVYANLDDIRLVTVRATSE